ncbi:MAG: hypothetical protein OJF51_000096 [Nitrospira sp.]|nr:MAG: hypothetical protein OJF51_000096 [Nitrospira sp.]
MRMVQKPSSVVLASLKTSLRLCPVKGASRRAGLGG